MFKIEHKANALVCHEKTNTLSRLSCAGDPSVWGAEMGTGTNGGLVRCAYSGFIDGEALRTCSSGGAATILAKGFADGGGVVFGVVYSRDFLAAEYSVATTAGGVDKFIGTKYIPVRAVVDGVPLADSVEKCLKSGRKVLLFGTACLLARIKNLCVGRQAPTDGLYCVSNICHGPAPMEAHADFIRGLETRYGSKITNYTVRYKEQGWKPFYVRAEFENGKVHLEEFARSNFGKAFYNVVRPVCAKCPYKGSGHQGDLVLGDHWGLADGDLGWNPDGVSLILVRTDKGMELANILLASECFTAVEADVDSALEANPMFYERRCGDINYETFMTTLKDYGLAKTIKKLKIEHIPKWIRFKTITKGLLERLRLLK